jgi:3-methyladenine DNA glycosylase AlkD
MEVAMTPKKQAAALVAQLKSVSTEERRVGMQNYFTTDQNILGVTTPDLRFIMKAARKELQSADASHVLALGLELVRQGSLEARQLGYELVAGHKATMATLTVKQLEELGEGNDNWASVDSFSCMITGILWLRGQLSDGTFEKWVRSDNLWWRRTAVVSTTPLNQKSKGGTGDFQRTLAMVGPVQHEKHPMIWKAVSWALRNLVQWDKDRVAAYVDANEATLPAPVKREVRKKIATGVKNPK